MNRLMLLACALAVTVTAEAKDPPRDFPKPGPSTIDDLLNRPAEHEVQVKTSPKPPKSRNAGPPDVTIKVDQPKNLVYIDFTNVGGDLRNSDNDWSVEFTPPIDPVDIVYESGDKMKMRLAPDPGNYELELLAVGATSGFVRKKEKFTVRGVQKPGPGPVSPVPIESKGSKLRPGEDPIEIVKAAAAAVKSEKRIAEAHAIAAALGSCESWAECLRPARDAVVNVGGNAGAWREFFKTVNELFFDLRVEGLLDAEFTEARAVRNVARVLANQ